MRVECIRQTRDIGIFEITVAIKDPLFFGPLDKLDEALSVILDKIENLLEGDEDEKIDLTELGMQHEMEEEGWKDR